MLSIMSLTPLLMRKQMDFTKKLLTRQQSVGKSRLTSECSSNYFFVNKTLTYIRYGKSLVHFDPIAERKLRLKIDLYVVPTVALLYLFCFIDRANIGTHHTLASINVTSH
jgi:hypothetical protein